MELPRLPWWGWLLIVVAIAATAGGVAVVFVMSDKEEALMANLQPDFADRLRAFLAACDSQGTPLFVYQTLRRVAEEQTHIADGTSHLSNPANSLHCPQEPDGLARAADTWPKGVPFTDDTTASGILRDLEDLARQFGLRNIDSAKFKDLGHWQDL